MPAVTKFETILAGPILRRIEPSLVSVWLALSVPRSVQLGLWSGEMATGSGTDFFGLPDALHQSTTKPSIRIGDKLHLVLVTLHLNNTTPLVPGQLYAYNLILTGGPENEDLKSLSLLIDQDTSDEPKHLALGYQPHMLPTFVMPPNELTGLNLFHTSCRKAHGFGEDGLAALDLLMERAGSDVTKRPHQLFLTGDQIYADDVAMPLLPILTDTGRVLLGIKENLLVNNIPIEVSTNNFPTGRRRKLVTESAGFTSGVASSHLLSFGEYCALYLMSWSNTLWPKLPDHEVLEEPSPPPADPDILSPLASKDELKKLQHIYEKEKKRLATFQNGLPAVRRILANVPVYMIFDDHEVTDDWYLTRIWKQQVLSKSLGKNVLRNGLLSYALFQAWGNDPDKFLNRDYAELIAHAQQLFPASASEGPQAGAASIIDPLLGLEESSRTLKWHYVAVSGPANTLVLDTRTRRSFTNDYTPPGLLDELALAEQLPDSLVPTAGAEVLLVVSPAPVLGLPLFEELIQPVITPGIDGWHAMKAIFKGKKADLEGHFANDMEAWALDPYGFENFLKKLFPYKKVVLLSGDVHFGFSSLLDYWKKGEATPTRIVQLVASSAKNEVDKWTKMLLSGGTAQHLFGRGYIPAERMGWERSTDLIEEIKTPSGNIPPRLRQRLNNNPALLPTKGWPAGTTMATGVAPDWSWRLNILQDDRPDDDSPGARPMGAQPKKIVTDIDESNPAAGYAAMLQRHEDAVLNNMTRRIVWASQVGKISFSGTGPTLKVQHSLHFVHPKGPKPADPDRYYLSEISLAPTADPPPTLPSVPV